MSVGDLRQWETQEREGGVSSPTPELPVRLPPAYRERSSWRFGDNTPHDTPYLNITLTLSFLFFSLPVFLFVTPFLSLPPTLLLLSLLELGAERAKHEAGACCGKMVFRICLGLSEQDRK